MDKVLAETMPERAAELFRALGNPVRYGVVARLARDGEICACDFTEHFEVSQPTISGHLRALRDAGLVRTRRRGTNICYSLDPGVLAELGRIVGELSG